MTAVALRQPRERVMLVNAGLAFVGDLAGKAAALVGVAVAARLLSTGEFARLGVALAATSLVTSALDAGFSVLIVREGAADPLGRGALVRASIRARAPIAAVAVAGGLAFGVSTGELAPAVLVVTGAALGAVSLTVLSAFRSAQDLRPEAVQKTVVAAANVCALAVAVLLVPTATAALLALVVAPALSLPFLARRAVPLLRRASERAAAVGGLRAAVPFALLGLATLVYYRSGTLLLGALSTPAETAAYTVASTVAFGLLIVPNAISTGLLPRLSAERNAGGVRRPARTSLVVAAGTSLVVAALVVAVAPWALPVFFGGRAEGVLMPLAILAVGTVVIAVNGTLGTVLVAARRLRLLAVQVGVSLVVNLACGVVLAARFGAVGASLATVATEVVALVVLVAAVQAARPGVWRRTPRGEVAAAVPGWQGP